MRKSEIRRFQPLGPLKILQVSSHSVRLRSSREVLELSALAPNLFRVRLARGKELLGHRSWAVVKTDWKTTPTVIRARNSGVTIETQSGKLSMRTSDGSWKLTDVSENEVFCAIPRKTGFEGHECQLLLRLTEEEALFGLGETTGTFNKRGLHRVFWNIDVLGHAPAIHPSLQSLYLSIPFCISIREGRAAGLFWDNPARQSWDLGQTKSDEWEMRAASGEIDLYLFLGPQVSDVVSGFTELTGRMPLPPRWALGYHQCRYSYESRARVEAIARNFRRKKIPCDALYLDIHHMDGYRVFSFGKAFPKPSQFIGQLAKQGFKVVTIVDPGVKEEGKFEVLKRGKTLHAFVREPNGKKDYVGKVWPGRVRFPDYTNAGTRAWWGAEQGRLQKLGVAGFWNDMNEPANFALPSKTLPENCLHHSDCGRVRHGEVHNVYGMQMARASYEGALAGEPDRRPFVITRAGYAGVQRYALVWTGDNSSVWEHLGDSLQMLLNLGLSGVAFCGSDVGGFLDNPTAELLARWTQFAAFTPFFRNHSNIGTHNQEPWAYGAKVEAICKRYIELRYRLLPYFYSLFVEAQRTGHPIMRPLFWHFQDDPIAVAVDDQFLLGANLLAAPVLRQGATARAVYLPGGEWFDFWTGAHHIGGTHVLAKAPLHIIPLYVRAGSIIPMGEVQQFVGQKAHSTIDLHVWTGARGELVWYEDDAVSLAHTRGKSCERRIETTSSGSNGRLHFSEAKGQYASEVKLWRVHAHGLRPKTKAVVNGRNVRARFHKASDSFIFEVTNSRHDIEVRLAS